MTSFTDRLAAMCAPEIAECIRANDSDRAADMITALATMLGRTVARATNGNPKGIDIMLTGAEQVAADEAADMASFMSSVNAGGTQQ